jgi:LytR cell envelope-related transcriptional attenuator
VDHPAHSTELVRPWRTATLIATAIAGLELVLLVVAGIILLGKSLAPQVHAAAQRRTHTPAVSKPAPVSKPKPSRPARTAPPLPRARTHVVVLNGNGIQGAAAEAASLVRARGYSVRKVGNAPRTGYARTMVEYRPGFRAEAVRFGRDLNVGLIAPLDGMKPAQLHGVHLVLFLGLSR